MNIYRRELKSSFKSTVVWVIASCGVAVLYLTFFSMLKDDMDSLMKLVENMPTVIQKAFGLQAENFSTPLGYYGIVCIYTSMLMGIQAMNLGIGIISKEERERTADFLLTKPVSRVKVMTSKLLSALTVFAATNIIYSVVVFVTMHALSAENYAAPLVLINLSLFFMQTLFFSIGFIVSNFAKKIKAVLPFSLGIVFFFFAISKFVVQSNDDKMRYLTPFQYFDAQYIAANNCYETDFTIIAAVITAVCICMSYYLFKKRNVHAV